MPFPLLYYHAVYKVEQKGRKEAAADRKKKAASAVASQQVVTMEIDTESPTPVLTDTPDTMDPSN